MKVIGVDIGGMSIKCGVVNEKGEVLKTFIFPVDNKISGDTTIKEFANKLNIFIKENNINAEGIGVGIPGTLDIEQGKIIFSPNLLTWNNLKIAKILEEKTNLKVKITNDANAAALGEAIFGSGKDYSSLIMITLGTGVGGGIVIDHKLYEGNKGQGAELGHSVLVYNGEECGCGRKGCFERYASASALIKQTKAKMKENKDSLLWKLVNNDIEQVNGKTAWDAEKQGDKAAKEVIDQYISYLGEGLMNYCNIFRPEIIVLSGGIAKQGDYLINKLINYMEKGNYGIKKTEKVKLAIASIGYESGIIGAASLLLKK